jgi:hypothetical protein
MAQRYTNVTQFVVASRSLLQDLISPYRYTDGEVVFALNQAIGAINRIRPDIFLDLKYQRPLRKSDVDDGLPGVYTTTDIAFLSDNVTYDGANGTMVPIPSKYFEPTLWFITGWLQLFDVADTQDQRSQAFLAKFNQHLMMLGAA